MVASFAWKALHPKTLRAPSWIRSGTACAARRPSKASAKALANSSVVNLAQFLAPFKPVLPQQVPPKLPLLSGVSANLYLPATPGPGHAPQNSATFFATPLIH